MRLTSFIVGIAVWAVDSFIWLSGIPYIEMEKSTRLLLGMNVAIGLMVACIGVEVFFPRRPDPRKQITP